MLRKIKITNPASLLLGDRYNISNVAQFLLLVFEGLVLLGITVAFWYHIDPSQGLRDAWFWTLWLAVPIFGLRLWLFKRLWTHTPLHPLLILFVIVAAFSYTHAAFQRESFLAPMGRPLLGMWTFVYLVEVTRATKSLRVVMILMMGISACLSMLALTSSQWLEEKSRVFWDAIQALPRFNYRAVATDLDGQVCSPIVDWFHASNCFNPQVTLSNAFLGFNVNEIAGALAWIVPVMAGFALMVSAKKVEDEKRYNISWFLMRVISGIIFLIGFTALLFGQSRFAIAGVLVALLVLAIFALSRPIWRYLALAAVVLLILFQYAVFINFFTPRNTDSAAEQAVGVSVRDENSVETRLSIWQRSLMMMRDRPMAGIGMYMFRTAVSRDPYRIPYYVENDLFPPPHAHNEWLNIGAEMGVLGLILFVAMQVTTLWMLWQGWRKGDQIVRTVALATFAGLLAHAAYGMGDAVALWDRFQFVLWWLVGLTGGQYILMKLQLNEDVSDISVETIEQDPVTQVS